MVEENTQETKKEGIKALEGKMSQQKRTVPRACKCCGKDFFVKKQEVKKGKGIYCSKSCSAKSHTGEASPGWKGGLMTLQQRAQDRAKKAVKNGELQRQPCEICGSTRFVEGHHDDYSKPLEVCWLCRSCHAKEDGRIRNITKKVVKVVVKSPAQLAVVYRGAR